MGLFSLIPLVVASLNTSFLSYHIAKRNIPQAFEAYHKEKLVTNQHDFTKLQEIAFGIIEEGFLSKDPEDNILALFGAGVCQNERFLPYIEELFNQASPELQLAAIGFLSKFQSEKASSIIQKALGSPYLELRMEALYTLASNKDPKTLFQTEALLAKLPPKGALLFPEILALLGTEEATKVFRKLFVHPDYQVRLSCILSVIQFKRDDLLPNLRALSLQQDAASVEASAFAFGLFKDSTSRERLIQLSKNKNKNVSLSALYSLHQLGEEGALPQIEIKAMEGDLFAITLLGLIDEGTKTLITLKSSKDLQIRGNAIFALLEKRSDECLPDLIEFMLEDAKDFACEEIFSQGRVLKAFRITPSAKEHIKEDPIKKQQVFAFREKLLKKASLLKTDSFLNLAKTLLQKGDSPLTSPLISLLESLQNEQALELLKLYQDKPGAPLTRAWCTLTLCRLKEDPLLRKALQNFLSSKKEVPLIRFKPLVSKEKQEFISSHHLTPEDTSALLIESLEWLAKRQDLFAIDTLLNLIEKGNEKNKYALAGLLIQATQ